ncbi:Serpin B9 [Orchesella cincta]|uniref:Serpin B9 n=1 Tax=Orchesella cincta TaxID=48709 RepID=A0A1D2N5J2_ORCCI|nr:Serpin B9 [Orchesella cincta]
MTVIIGNASGTSNEIPIDEVKQEPSKPISDRTPDLAVPIIATPTTNTTSSENINNTVIADVDTKTVPRAPRPQQKQPNVINQFAQRLNPKIFGRPNKFQNVSSTSAPTSNINANTANNTISTKPRPSVQTPSRIPTIMWSPVSVFNSLTPLLFAANGKTQTELQNILLPTQTPITPGKVTNSSSSFSSFNYTYGIGLELPKNSREFSSATGLFSRVDSPLNTEYIQNVQRNVENVDVQEVDFANVSVAVKNINSWVHERTAGMIEGVMDEGQIDPATFLVLVNCVRFKAMWVAPFDEDLTKISNFTGSNGVQSVRMMHQRSTQLYAKYPFSHHVDDDDEDEDGNDAPVAPFQVLELPYEDHQFSSIFILPNSTDDLLSTMEYVETLGIENIRKMMGPVEVDFSVPKFQINSDVNIEDALVESGLTTLFNPSQANLTRLLPSLVPQSEKDVDSAENSTASKTINKFIPAPYLSKIVHRTIFEISEEGTKAGAVTAISIVPLSALSDHHLIRFTLDRPFIVYLVKNNTILFQGVIASLPELNEEQVKNEVKINADTQNTNTTSRDSIVKANTTQNAKSQENQLSQRGSQKEDDSPWWVPPSVPAYLKNETVDKDAAPANPEFTNQTSSSSAVTVTEDMPDSNVPSATSEIFITEPSAISFTKYQQPEPMDPNGIRFPATAPQLRKHLIKPRLNDNVKFKDHLMHWMNVY